METKYRYFSTYSQPVERFAEICRLASVNMGVRSSTMAIQDSQCGIYFYFDSEESLLLFLLEI